MLVAKEVVVEHAGDMPLPKTPQPEIKGKRKKAAKDPSVAGANANDNPSSKVGPCLPLETEDGGEAFAEDQEKETVVKKQARRKREPDPLPCLDPTTEHLDRLIKEAFTPPPRPIPNLGYACLNMDLRELKPPVFTSRDCILRTLQEKGLEHLGALTLANVRDLARVIQWNHEHGIRLFRLSSVLQPWMGVHSIRDFPQFSEIKAALRFAGDLARVYDQRLTFHPSHFVKLAAPDKELVSKSMSELEAHSLLLDLMGFQPSLWNKINIHVGGVYGDKQETLTRWADNYKRLSPSCRARITVENDDVASAFSLEDLLQLHKSCGVALVFDFHHHRFNAGNLTEEEAFKAALKTWPSGIRPIVHWSESQRGRKPHAHSDFVRGPIYLYGLEGDVDVMIEAKCKERALIHYRDGLPIPADESDDEGEEGLVPRAARTALKFLNN